MTGLPITATRPLRLELRRPAAFWLAAVLLVLLLFASAAPSPLYVVFQQQWEFSALTLTVIFGIYALMLLRALLVAGSVSDHAGRKPTLLAGLALELVAMVLFAQAQGVAWLIAARALQGIATGVAMGALSAALLDLQPDHAPRRGALVGVAAPMVGLATGALGTGLLVDHAPAPTHLVFWLAGLLVAVGALLVLAMPETVRPDGAWRAALRPRVGVPAELQGTFVATLPCLAATWALGGLILSLGPSLTAGVLDHRSHVDGALPIFILAGVSAITSIAVRALDARTTARAGLLALETGVGIALVAIALDSYGLLLAGTAVAGLGFGPAFGGAFRALTAQAPPARRAALVSAILAVAYLAFSLPAIAAGVAITQFGLHDTTVVYGGVLMVVAIVALGLSDRFEDPSS